MGGSVLRAENRGHMAENTLELALRDNEGRVLDDNRKDLKDSKTQSGIYTVVQNINNRRGRSIRSKVVSQHMVQPIHSNVISFRTHFFIVQTFDKWSYIVCTTHLFLHLTFSIYFLPAYLHISLTTHSAALRISGATTQRILLEKPFFFTSFARFRKSISIIPAQLMFFLLPFPFSLYHYDFGSIASYKVNPNTRKLE